MLAFALLLLATGCGGSSNASSTPDLAPYYTQALDWTHCGASGMTDTARKQLHDQQSVSDMQCATMVVPRDYARPSRGVFRLALSRFPTRATTGRLGSLAFNFGGPGTPGVDQLALEVGDYEKLRSRYDLIGIDPRGWGQSDPLTCDKPRNPSSDTVPPRLLPPRTPPPALAAAGDPGTALGGYAQGRIDFARACERWSGPSLPYVGTVPSARDLDVLRQALGDARLNFFGMSYGSQLGADYAHLFPHRTGRIALDGIVDPTLDTQQDQLAVTVAEQQGVDNFLRDCLNQASTCPFTGTLATSSAQLLAAYRALADHPHASAQGVLDQGAFTAALSDALYQPDSWATLRQAFTSLLHDDDAGPLAHLGGAKPPGNGVPTVVDPPDDNGSAVDAAVGCRDTADRPTPGEVLSVLPQFTAASPVLGTDNATTLLACTGWPVAGDESWRSVRADGAPPILLVGTRTDPSTPYPGAAHMAQATGVGVVLTYAGQGHIAYRLSSCIRDRTNAFLLDGTLPGGSTVCN